MEPFRSSILFQTYRFDCDRFLSFHITPEGNARAEQNPYSTHRVFRRRLIGVAEQRWNQACYQEVLDASPPGTIAYTREPAVDELLGLAPFSNLENVLDYLRSEEPPQFIIKPAITAPTDLVEGLETTYEAYKMKPETISFDLLWIQPNKDNTY